MTRKVLEFSCQLEDLTATEALGEALGSHLSAGDLVILTGSLGAGKTTLTQSLGLGLNVREGIISPTFVLARQHPSLADGPGLIHVDAYRLNGDSDVDTLDLESTLADSVTVVEWGLGKVEHLSDSRLEIQLDREVWAVPASNPWEESDEELDEPRLFTLKAIGPRWAEENFTELKNALLQAIGLQHSGETHA
ncbi:tRNA (adenosine(37)-N6)-threonylcarbamoyltransferase complex ATPase subunit type 1 TsaE [Arthrobacter sp. MYb229]|uniref:tRNA (adenosine(37)-N6)-threonylcarbamoyltransferase complex ATPase subunit type 1 TsaE n=1 Tax=Micrococcaceae TaxID=1268 RepID=UPI000BB928D1|nr:MULTISPECIES: tRNA (adenosine(37)-N6)-threonylcarbamoyltransferase complex ATPase subunit type 1 TsaE [Micrococcaceae]PCC29883.1 tRNA (adenosine(37)-N6)-threonylcarbamoyltransferase complex ATPase subunit type 1 TsaE [Glutamicibacter sp. BW80]PRA06123.1 tRNA (adenosine(37)-N6)-threonylcarbamoyltransferase complex ATPase subunit type 1 TsaE [Arthrobacter sp. MYb229]PRB53025.1 tRNA (adenosine(37)-N6)-threonylcarbamoyltransferase complex ATPase subunit type 1 TsaE [Arthrobacter sp. MYb216]